MSGDIRDEEVFHDETYYNSCGGSYTPKSIMETPDDEIADKIISVNANITLKLMIYFGIFYLVMKFLGILKV